MTDPAVRLVLQQAIDVEGPISAAVETLGISYRASRNSVSVANNLADTPPGSAGPGGRAALRGEPGSPPAGGN